MRDLWGELSKGLDITGQPEGNNGLEAFGAGEIGAQPDFFQGFEDCGLGIEGSPAWFLGFGFLEAFILAE